MVRMYTTSAQETRQANLGIHSRIAAAHVTQKSNQSRLSAKSRRLGSRVSCRGCTHSKRSLRHPLECMVDVAVKEKGYGVEKERKERGWHIIIRQIPSKT